MKPKIGIVNTDKKTVQPDNDIVTKLMLNETSFDNAMVRSEIYEVFSNSDKRDSLLRILDELNMTLNDLIEHRERGSSQTHLSDIFHRSVKEPDVRDRNLIVEKVHFNMKDISNQRDEGIFNPVSNFLRIFLFQRNGIFIKGDDLLLQNRLKRHHRVVTRFWNP